MRARRIWISFWACEFDVGGVADWIKYLSIFTGSSSGNGRGERLQIGSGEALERETILPRIIIRVNVKSGQ
jgi:hypothetical protein